MIQKWPKDKAQVPSEIRPYFTLQEELSHQDGIVFRGERAVIPDTLRSAITSVYIHHIWVLKDAYAELESVSTGWA